MPNVTAPVRLMQSGEAITQFTDTASTTVTSFTYPNQQEAINVINKGVAAVTLTVNGTNYTIQPGQNQSISARFTSFAIQSATGTQQFEATAWSFEKDDIQLVGSVLFAGEDQTNDLQKVEQRYNYKNLNSLVTTTVKSTPGFLHALIINTAGATGNTITLYDSTTASGEKIATIDATALTHRIYNVQFSLGLTVVVAGGTAGDITIAYR